MPIKKRVLIAVIISAIVIAVTFVAFFTVTAQREAMHWTGFSFMIVAEILTAGGIILLESSESRMNGLMLRSGIYSTLLIYLSTSVIVSIVFMAIQKSSVQWMVFVQILLLAAAAIVTVLFFAGTSYVSEKNHKTMESVMKLQQMSDRIKVLLADPENQSFAELLHKIYEALEYCDHSVTVPSDNTILLKSSELEEALKSTSEEKEKRINVIAEEILLLVQQRTLEAKESKRGSF